MIIRLPAYKYHPDPVATGSVVRSDAPCEICGEAPGYVYAGPIRTANGFTGPICPWCIAYGSAQLWALASFVAPSAVGAHIGGTVAPDTAAEVVFRTPGIGTWGDPWLTHCGEPMEYHGRAGRDDLERLGRIFVDSLREFEGYNSLDTAFNFRALVTRLDTAIGPFAQVFRCRHCSDYRGYIR